ncbi:MAG: co-chaperone GroES [bacterium]
MSTKEKKVNKIEPLADRVLIKEFAEDDSETRTKSGIIIPASASGDKGAKKGEVIAVGPGKYEDGKLIPVSVKPGETVLFSWGDKVKIDGEEYYILRETEIIAIIK